MPRVIHFEIHAEDPERAVTFYQRVFGWTCTKWSGPVEYCSKIRYPSDRVHWRSIAPFGPYISVFTPPPSAGYVSDTLAPREPSAFVE